MLAESKPAEAIAVLDTAIPTARQAKDPQLTDLQILLAKCHIAAKDWDKAAAAATEVAQANPRMSRILNGAILYGRGNAAQALDELHAGLAASNAPIDPVWVMGVLDSIAGAVTQPGADTLEKLADCYRVENGFASAYPYYEAALKQPGISGDAGKRMRRWLLKCHIRARQFDQVAEEIDAITAESPMIGPWSYYSLSSFYRSKGQYEKALACYAKVYPPDPKLPGPDPNTVRRELLECYIGAKDWDKAMGMIETLRAQNPNDPSLHECLGQIYQGQERYLEAIAEFKQVIHRQDAVSARLRLAECYRAGLDKAAAAALVQELVDKYPMDGPSLPTIAGRLYQDLEQYDRAMGNYKFIVETFPKARWQVWDALFTIGECCYAQGKGEEALTYIKDFYAKHPDRPLDLALAYGKTLLYAAKAPAQAALVLSKAIEEHPNDKLAQELRPLLLLAYSEAGQIDKVTAVLNTLCADAEPAKKPAYLAALGDHYSESKKYREAAGAYRAVLMLKDSTEELKARAQYSLALAFHESNMPGAARKAMEEASQRNAGEWSRKARGMIFVWNNYGAERVKK